MEAVINIAEYAKHLNEVNTTLGINLRRDIEDYVRKGTHRGQSMGNTGLLSEIEKNTPLSDNLGKPVRRGGGVDTVPEGKGKWTSGKSGSAVHAAYLWRDEITTQGTTTTVKIRNDAIYSEFLEFGSTPGKRPWPNVSSYPEPRTFKAKDLNFEGVHGSRANKIWAGGRWDHVAGGPVAMAMSSTGREGWHSRSKGYSFDEFINRWILEARAALSGERKNRARNR